MDADVFTKQYGKQPDYIEELSDETRKAIEKLENELADMKKRTEAIEKSYSWKIGRAVTWVPRKISSIKKGR